MEKVVWNKKCSDLDLEKIHDLCEGVRAKCDIMTAKASKQVRRERDEVKEIKKASNY